MAEIILYTKNNCPYSREAKSLCNILYIPYQEYSIDGNNPKYNQIKQNLFKTFKHNSFPIIIINKTVIGGYSELVDAYHSKKLHKLCAKIGINIIN